jgi:Flp pilus assembly protein TadG
MLHPRRGRDREHGQMLVLFALSLVVILAFAAIVVDLGLLRNDRQNLVNTLDAGALAGGTLLPVDGSQTGKAAAIESLINTTIAANYPGLPTSAYTITYKCLIGVDASGQPNVPRDVPAACDPSKSLRRSAQTGDFTGAGPTRSSACDPTQGDKCNVVEITGSVTQPFSLGPVVGVNSGSTGVVVSVACNGACGAPPSKLNDVELLIDKSGSMSRNYSNGHNRVYWAGAAAKQLVADLNNNGGISATGNRVGITTFQGEPGSSTAGERYDGQDVNHPDAWTSTAAQLDTLIDTVTNSADGNTPTADGISAAAADLTSKARPSSPTVQRVLIFLSDGRPQPDLGPNGEYAPPGTLVTDNERPTKAEVDGYLGSADVAYSIMIGVVPDPYPYPTGAVTTPPNNLDNNIVDPDMMKLLAKPDVATHYFNVVDGSGLPGVFHQIAADILGANAHLIQLYPAPVVTGVSPSSGTVLGGTPITISGKYLTGATSVSFGGVAIDCTDASHPCATTDTQITVTTPPGSGQVDVIVTTPGGTSTITPADHFTYN